jgi:bifunctional NMN adenylyltransferase/nudix hydrolase
MTSTTSTLGVIVGRFQEDRLHPGHVALIQHVLDTSDRVIIFLGTTPTRGTKTNPLDFETRSIMLENTFCEAYWAGRLLVRGVPDQGTDEAWSQYLDHLITKVQGMLWYTHRHPDPENEIVTMHGSRDSFLQHYTGKHQKAEFPAVPSNSGTLVRKRLGTSPRFTEDFRAGVIYSTQQRYPISYQTVDIAILHRLHGKEPYVLLGRKPGETVWRFPGGFVDPTDLTLEAAAAREAMEETGLVVHDLRYVASFRVDDWRYRNDADQIMTAFFVTEASSEKDVVQAKAGDDLADVAWTSLSKLIESINPTHLPLAQALVELLS